METGKLKNGWRRSRHNRRDRVARRAKASGNGRLNRRVAARAVLMVCTLLLLAVAALAHPAWGIAIDRQGQVYFSDVDHNTVWKVGADGRPVALLTNKTLARAFHRRSGQPLRRPRLLRRGQ